MAKSILKDLKVSKKLAESNLNIEYFFLKIQKLIKMTKSQKLDLADFSFSQIDSTSLTKKNYFRLSPDSIKTLRSHEQNFD